MLNSALQFNNAALPTSQIIFNYSSRSGVVLIDSCFTERKKQLTQWWHRMQDYELEFNFRVPKPEKTKQPQNNCHKMVRSVNEIDTYLQATIIEYSTVK